MGVPRQAQQRLAERHQVVGSARAVSEHEARAAGGACEGSLGCGVAGESIVDADDREGRAA